ncbi:hypothetical protein N309_04575, partial [Tinamus guttatus]
LHGIVAAVGARGSERLSDVVQDQRHVLQAAGNEGLHEGHVASEVRVAVVLPHHITGPVPQHLRLCLD